MSWDWMEIFQPSLRHVREERERLELTVEHPDSGAPPLGIDLDKGTARFTMPHAGPDSGPDAGPDSESDRERPETDGPQSD